MENKQLIKYKESFISKKKDFSLIYLKVKKKLMCKKHLTR